MSERPKRVRTLKKTRVSNLKLRTLLVTLLDDGGVHDVNKALCRHYRHCLVKKKLSACSLTEVKFETSLVVLQM